MRDWFVVSLGLRGLIDLLESLLANHEISYFFVLMSDLWESLLILLRVCESFIGIITCESQKQLLLNAKRIVLSCHSCQRVMLRTHDYYAVIMRNESTDVCGIYGSCFSVYNKSSVWALTGLVFTQNASLINTVLHSNLNFGLQKPYTNALAAVLKK